MIFEFAVVVVTYSKYLVATALPGAPNLVAERPNGCGAVRSETKISTSLLILPLEPFSIIHSST